MKPVDINVQVPSIEEVKTHWANHKREYLIGGSCLIVGFIFRRPMRVVVVVNHNIPA